jgi:hypothetical protein
MSCAAFAILFHWKGATAVNIILGASILFIGSILVLAITLALLVEYVGFPGRNPPE